MSETATGSRQRTTALALATLAFTTNFWAWGLLSPLAPDYRELLGLSAFADVDPGRHAGAVGVGVPDPHRGDPTPFGRRLADAVRVAHHCRPRGAVRHLGGFVAFGVYLPTYLTQVFGLETADAGARAAGFIILTTVARPLSGWLSDRAGDGVVLVAALAVGAAGGLGGFFPPLVMGAVFKATDSYAIGLVVLSLTALVGWSTRTGASSPKAAPPYRADEASLRVECGEHPLGRRYRDVRIDDIGMRCPPERHAELRRQHADATGATSSAPS